MFKPKFPKKIILLGTSSILLSGCASLDPNKPAEIRDIVVVIGNIIFILAPAAAIALLIMLIWGGFQFMTSGGDPKAASGARSTMTYAIIGIILVVISWLILLLIESLTGVNVTQVNIP